MKKPMKIFCGQFEKPYMFGDRGVQQYNLKSKRWKGLIQTPDDAWLAEMKKRRQFGQSKKDKVKIYDYDLLKNKFDEAVIRLQEICLHHNYKWMNEMWAIGHSTGYKVKVCLNCNKTLERRLKQQTKKGAKQND